jgi:hypothetical protein
MIANVLFSLLLAAAAPPPPNCVDGRCPDRAMNVTLPDFQTAPAPNVHLENFEYVVPGQMPGSAVDYDQMLRLQEQVRLVARANLAGSQSKFGVRVIYALTPDQPAQFKMQVAEAPPAEAPRLKQFYMQASALKDFHCTKGMIYIVFDYRVSPATTAKHSKGR